MSTSNPGFGLRLLWAFQFFFAILANADFARRVAQLRNMDTTSDAEPANAPEKVAEKSAPSMTPPAATQTEASAKAKADPQAPVLQLLGLLQQEARLIDFLQEDVTAYGDADIGAAARVVHGGCRKVLQQYIELTPVRQEAEQSRITVAEGFDPSEIRLTGRVSGQPPFSGTLVHRGWKVTRVELPVLAAGHNTHVLAPAEVEI